METPVQFAPECLGPIRSGVKGAVKRFGDVIDLEPLARAQQILHLIPDIWVFGPVVAIRRDEEHAANHRSDVAWMHARIDRNLRDGKAQSLRRVLTDRDFRLGTTVAVSL